MGMKEWDEKTTFGEKYGPAMKITSKEMAAAYFERCVAHMMKYHKCGREEAESIERSNLGYWAGYYDNKTRLRVEKLFLCQHPLFGVADDPVTPEKAIAIGLNLGEKK